LSARARALALQFALHVHQVTGFPTCQTLAPGASCNLIDRQVYLGCVTCDGICAALAGVRATRYAAAGDALLDVPLVCCIAARDMAVNFITFATVRVARAAMTNSVLGADRDADVALTSCQLAGTYLSVGGPGTRSHGAGAAAGSSANQDRPRRTTMASTTRTRMTATCARRCRGAGAG
jgi:hypothetical protein